MNIAVEEINACQKKLTIQLSTEEVNQQYQTIIQDFRTNAAIPGFRKGKASISTIKRRFKQDISHEVKEKLLENSLKDALVEQKISPIGTPSLDVKNVKVAESQPLEYTVEVEFLPPFELAEYRGIQVTKPRVADVPDSSVNQAIESLQRQNAVNEPIDDAAHLISPRDSVSIDYQRFLDGKPFGEVVQNYTFWLEIDPVLPEFSQNILGKKKGDHVEFSIQYGEDLKDKELAGKTMQFAVDIVNIEKVILPEIDDEFAKDLEQESLEALKNKLREDLKKRQELDAVADAKNRMLTTLADTYTFAIPPSLLRDQKKQSPGKSDEEICKMLRAGILLVKIQEKEAITVTDEEVNSAVENMAMHYQVPVAAMKSYLAEHGGLPRIGADIGESKTLTFLYDHAQITEE